MRPSFHDRGSLTSDFDAIRISLASPEKIMELDREMEYLIEPEEALGGGGTIE